MQVSFSFVIKSGENFTVFPMNGAVAMAGNDRSCNLEAKYIGLTLVNLETRMGQHKNDITSNKADENISGISKHARHCNSTIDWENPEILSTFNDKTKGNMQQNLLLESLEIRRHGTSSGLGLNDPQLCVKSNAWDPILSNIKDK